ncbi:hypothetical protein A3F07_01605 [candidate division WWE3 bacterium RIFCSPHIGHO2_12_FULL_38_15]|uniref:Uncharacterized protein n=1 Tax=candidate division WWE3 bacterium RIFCSPHIGHO2_02_FULL_38_14 TaxID=1802620 RepID=A0A1F4V908_UNCKA|nr:MAG: hypothetical protein A2793_01695 [candidate division WWE3 bacterium RIFCSPHIGHO2_01_FULL_38_45]OGC48401.1 MAG: hypothetical protein A3F07_01605 [candidate division WWE3 bacterium RIFCSPHIGHO2_12_FULL_38_15]OGC53624.1 MAG: hypothetical protein A3D91_04250 [candidate division WWE3 bacterium RIFCSPHIGHO2_02_FULL_38_14]OGC54334.1 MAG: hypothetical protein A3B64_02400 [candidate division WWE3 bacterium RIFCSPLOWO2_01_FULL_37_24]
MLCRHAVNSALITQPFLLHFDKPVIIGRIKYPPFLLTFDWLRACEQMSLACRKPVIRTSHKIGDEPMNKTCSIILLLIAILVISGCEEASPTANVTAITFPSRTATLVPTPSPTATASPTPTQKPTPTSTPLILAVQTDIKYKGGAGIYKGARALQEYYIGRVPRGESAEVIGRAEFYKELEGTPQPVKTRWLQVKYGDKIGFSVYELFEQLSEEEYLALPVIDVDWESGTGLPIPTPTTTSTPTPSPTATASPTPTAYPNTPIPTKSGWIFGEDSKALINRVPTECSGIPSEFSNREEVQVFGRMKGEPYLYVKEEKSFAFVHKECLIWSGDISRMAEIVFPTSVPVPTPVPTPHTPATGQNRR